MSPIVHASSPGIWFGIDRFIVEDTPRLRGRRIALLTHDAAVTASVPKPLTPSRLAVLQSGTRLAALFSPEHGIGADAPDGAAVVDGTDRLTALPVRSLYGTGIRPSREMLADIEILLVDLQDVGARFYTYIWTLSYVLEACAETGVPVWVLDRPNPLGGDLGAAEGPIFDESIPAGLAGRWAVPIRHSLTIGELARLWNRERGIGADLRVIEMRGWHRSTRWPGLGLPFVPTSPAMPSYETAVFYPGTGLLEGLNVNEGRGTAAPFQLVGAPWMHGPALADALNALGLAGMIARPVEYTPSSGRHAGRRCSGVMLHVTDDLALRPVALGFHLIALIWRLHPQDCAWANYPTAANPTGRGHFERLVGRSDVAPVLQHPPVDLRDQVSHWTEAREWSSRTSSHLLYN
jgi:uncharacterized protein YbbC (DUF1343 family)